MRQRQQRVYLLLPLLLQPPWLQLIVAAIGKMLNLTTLMNAEWLTPCPLVKLRLSSGFLEVMKMKGLVTQSKEKEKMCDVLDRNPNQKVIQSLKIVVEDKEDISHLTERATCHN